MPICLLYSSSYTSPQEVALFNCNIQQAHKVMEIIRNDGFDNVALESNFEQKLDDKIRNLQPE